MVSVPGIGAHVDGADPLAAAAGRDADLVQFFLGDPQDWKKPPERADLDVLRAADIPLYVHAAYVINVASPNNRIRIPSRTILDQHAAGAAALGAQALIVHAGHVPSGADPAVGFANWRKAVERTEFPLPVLIENTAGGDRAMGRRVEALARLWDTLGDLVDSRRIGVCLDTCHAHAGGEELLGVVDRVKAVTGRIDLVHCNNSKDGFDSRRDRHENLESGQIDPDLLLAVVAAADAPVVVETPGGREGQAADIAFLRAGLAR